MKHQSLSQSNIIFLSAPNKSYEGRQVNNIRKALTPDPIVIKYIRMWDEYFGYTNHGDLAYQHGMVSISDEGFANLPDQMAKTEHLIKSRYGNQRVLTA